MSFGFLPKLGAGGLIGGQLIGLLAATGFLIKKFIIEDYMRVKKGLSKQVFKKVITEYRKYPIYNMVPSILDSFTAALPMIFFSTYFNLSITGQYSLAIRLLYLPSSLIGAAVAQVYFQKLAEEYNQGGNISTIVQDTFKSLLFIAVPFCIVIMILGPWIFTFFFGSNWTISGVYSRILAPSMALKFVASPLSRVFGALNRQEISALWQITALAITALSVGISIILKNAFFSVLFLTISDLMIYSLYLFFIFRVSGIKLKNVFRIGN